MHTFGSTVRTLDSTGSRVTEMTMPREMNRGPNTMYHRFALNARIK